MGSAHGHLPVGAPRKEGSTLIELRIHDLSEAHYLISERPDDAYTPVVIIPQHSMPSLCCIPLCMVCIPSGFSAIVTRFGAEVQGDLQDGTWSDGCHCMSFLNNIDKLVSKQLIVFESPVKDVKTKDAITVHLDVLIVFEIFHARDFVYALGPEKFDDFLRSAQDEALRHIAFETSIDHIYDLFGRNMEHIIQELNDKFSKFGIKIHHFTVKDVRIPSEMANDFEEKTLFESKTTMQHMKQTFDRLKLNNDKGKSKLREECENARMAAEQQANVVQNQAVKETAEVVAQTARDIAELETSREAEVQKVVAHSELDISKMKSQIMALEREMNSRTQAEVGRVKAEADAFVKNKKTEASITVAGMLANGKQALGEAEGDAASAFASRRAFEAELKRLEILEQLIAQGTGKKIATSQENTVGLNQDNAVVTQVAQQGLEALRAKLAEITAASLAHLQQIHPRQQEMH